MKEKVEIRKWWRLIYDCNEILIVKIREKERYGKLEEGKVIK